MTANLIVVAWVTMTFLVMVASFLANFPAADEARASKADLESLGDRLNGSKVLAEYHVRYASALMWVHRLFAVGWVVAFGTGLAGVLIPPVEIPQAQTRAAILSSGLIVMEGMFAVVQGICLMLTLAMREARLAWRQAAMNELRQEARNVLMEERMTNVEEGLVANQEDQDELRGSK